MPIKKSNPRTSESSQGKKFSARSSSSPQRKKHNTQSSARFIPNLKQLNEASKELPDPDLWPEKTYLSPVEDDGKKHAIQFTLKSIKRGKEQTPRWTYEGKILIRNRDTSG